MPLSAETLYPLTSTSVVFPYCYDRPLRSIATRYVPAAESTIATGHQTRLVSYTLLFVGGISLSKSF